jgi:glycosyltransferase involved in cell wall biosynthesis
MRFHCLAILNTVTSKDYLACAFTQKVLKFCAMMTRRGHTVIHYGHKDSQVECTEHVTVISREKFNETYGKDDYKTNIPSFCLSSEATKEFNQNAIREVNARKQPGDWLLAFWGDGHKIICEGAGFGMKVCEPGIGYPYGYFAEYKIFESFAVYHSYTGINRLTNISCFCCILKKEIVIPNYFDPHDFVQKVLPMNKRGDYFLFVGRVLKSKGVDMAIKLTQFLGIPFKIAGQDSEKGLRQVGLWPPPPHVELLGYINTEQRKTLMAHAKAVVCLSIYVEPFCGTHVEAMFSGTPVITSNWGAFVEYNVHGVTGFRCRTFEEMVEAAKNIHTIDPQQCRAWAMKNFSMDRVALKYEEFFNFNV